MYLCVSNTTWQKPQNLKPQTQLNMLFSLGSYRLLKLHTMLSISLQHSFQGSIVFIKS